MRYRSDVDGLRAVAILAVIIYHFSPDLLPSGFLGVDVFFVISGYVITLHLGTRKNLSWSEYLLAFYSRRIKRLLPALLLCVVVTSALFLLFTTRAEKEIFLTGSSALIGLSNIYLLVRSADYFSLETMLNPFTQTWSLGVEEQFYLVFPFILAVAGYCRKELSSGSLRAINILLALSIVSIALFIYTRTTYQEFAFYSVFTRFWELALGALIAIILEKKYSSPSKNIFSSIFNYIVFIGLLAIFFMPKELQTISTIVAVLMSAGLIFITKPGNNVFALLASRPMVFIGLISYSLYLWHWSVLVLGKWTIGVGNTTIPYLLLLTFIISCGSYYFVEKPLRYARWFGGAGHTVFTGLWMAIVVAVIIPFSSIAFYTKYNNFVPGLFGVSAVPEQGFIACNESENLEKFDDPLASCLRAKHDHVTPHAVYLVGDSHAGQLFYMVESALKQKPFQLRFLNTGAPDDFPLGFVADDFVSAESLDYILANAKSGDVILMTFHRGRLNLERDRHISLEEEVEINDKTNNMLGNIRPYIEKFVSKGLKVVLIKDTPLMNAVSTSPSCYLQIKLMEESICKVSKLQDLHTRSRQELVFDTIAKEYENVFIWDPIPYIYEDTFDVVNNEGIYVMWDWNHISEYQSTLLSPSFKAFLENNVLEEHEATD